MTDPIRPTMAERYSRALESSHLEMSLEHRGAVDLLVAAGWVRDDLGTWLFRLRSEFDSINALELAACGRSVHAKLMALNKVTSLRPTMVLLDRYAQRRAARMRFAGTPRQIFLVAGYALDQWLSPRCHTCHGTGRVGVLGSARPLCPTCSGTGARRVRLGRTEAAHAFGCDLVQRIEIKTQYVAAQMRKFLKD